MRRWMLNLLSIFSVLLKYFRIKKINNICYNYVFSRFHWQTDNWCFPSSQKMISPKEVSPWTCQLKDENIKKQISIFDPIFVTFQCTLKQAYFYFSIYFKQFHLLSQSQEAIHIERIFFCMSPNRHTQLWRVYL